MYPNNMYQQLQSSLLLLNEITMEDGLVDIKVFEVGLYQVLVEEHHYLPQVAVHAEV